ncbi:glutamate--tRNA ligase [Candidatus Cytomitobacter primus]|uniref:Glutamate--tRNA ligase n=1 Tax=Candidatus Cytomitobacter primus TaxID=2066024 RepID=A0A5C0UE91_9PROT|nr:glutamate--tRNA ligase [Candidatus Cytomitobacter primus]QEK38406.1 glutamate--tRNA ligase [Candidatus Cytomitobacter primus]
MLCTRFAPSPTGLLHLGNIRTALLSYLWAQNNNAKLVLRFDDTDRVDTKYIDAIRNDLSWMGIKFDKEIFQSERNAIYSKWIEICKEKGIIYPAYETKEELDELRNRLSKEKKAPVYKKHYAKEKDGLSSGLEPHWRFELPNIKIEWNDIIRGKVSINLKSVSDPIIQKSDGSFTYMFTSVIDDIEEQISHIFRGEDHVTNTAIQIYMFDQINNLQIEYGHLPILLNKHGQRMSKRNNDESIKDLREEGFFPMTLSNQMVFIGKNEFHLCKSLDNLKDFADLKYSSSQIRWSKKEALKIQHKFVQSIKNDDLATYFGEQFGKWDLIKNEITFKQDFVDWKDIFEKKQIVSEEKTDLNYLNDLSLNTNNMQLDTNSSTLNTDDSKNNRNNQSTNLHELLNKSLDNIQATNWSAILEDIKNMENGKAILKKLRLILTGKKFGPSLLELLGNMDQEIIIFRLKNALSK